MCDVICFPSSDQAGIERAAQYHHQQGVTSLIASTVSASEATLLERIHILQVEVAAGTLAGIHLEGPFIDMHRCGAQDPQFIIPGDLAMTERLLTAGAGSIVSMTLAPETPHALEIAQILYKHGAIASWGHTSSDNKSAQKALNHAAMQGFFHRDSITHMFNCMNPLHHREPGMIGECLKALAQKKITAELIADGTHLAIETIQLMFDLFSPAELILISDAMEATGMPDGHYSLGSHRVQVVGGTARLALLTDINSENHQPELGAIAGSTSTLADVLRYTVFQAGISLTSAITSASLTPARSIGIAHSRGSLQVGKIADIVHWSERLQPIAVFRHGKQITSHNLAYP